jgi:hypothetical protein
MNDNLKVIEPEILNSSNFLPSLKSKDYAFIKDAIDIADIKFTYNFKNESSFDIVEQKYFKNDLIFFNLIKSSNFFQQLKKINISYLADSFFIRGKKNNYGTYPHIDGYYEFYPLENKEISFYTIWLPLTVCTRKTSTLCLLDKSQSPNYIEKIKLLADKNEKDVQKAINLVAEKIKDPKNKDFIYPRQLNDTWISSNYLKPGDAVIFKGNIIHGSTDCVEEFRYSIDIRVSNQYIEAITPELL